MATIMRSRARASIRIFLFTAHRIDEVSRVPVVSYSPANGELTKSGVRQPLFAYCRMCQLSRLRKENLTDAVYLR